VRLMPSVHPEVVVIGGTHPEVGFDLVRCAVRRGNGVGCGHHPRDNTGHEDADGQRRPPDDAGAALACRRGRARHTRR
jgi:hypothetical protein